jgi:ribulose-bisphosphate carboxylase large chain
MPQILSAIAGNVYGMKAVKKLKLLDIDFPKSLIESFQGPAFGIEGIKKLTKITNRPLLGTIVKPKVGLTEKQHAKVAYDAWLGGLDVVKDDENLTSMEFNDFYKRIDLTLKALKKAQKETGEVKIYLPNVTAETTEMLKRADFVIKNGGTHVMIDILTAGFSGLQTLRKHVDGKVAIHAHRAMHAALTRSKEHGISMLVIAKIARIIGVDQIHIGTAGVGKMNKEEDTYLKEELSEKIVPELGFRLKQNYYNIKSCLSVASGGLHPGSIPKLTRILGMDIVAQFGGGCHGHPDGTYAGAKAIRQATEAVLQHKTLPEYAKTHPELKKAIDLWGITN